MTGTRSLKDKLRDQIFRDGSMSVESYMEICLNDPEFGYYVTRSPIGEAGDFTTAPEISQIFGELVGLWAVSVFQSMSCPSPIKLIELGPGRGTLMSDALRAGRVAENFSRAIEIHLIETSPVLADQQRRTLSSVEQNIHWHTHLADVPDGPSIILANEFFDALPIRQLVWSREHWRERQIGLSDSGQFQFEVAQEPFSRVPDGLPQFEGLSEDTIFEQRPSASNLLKVIERRSESAPTAVLIIDYGCLNPCFGDSLQAVRRHKYADPLGSPGEVDLTAHVNFGALRDEAHELGLSVYGPISQSQFLISLGLTQRTNALLQVASPDQAKLIASGSDRLIDPALMGDLFKVLVLTSRDVVPPPPFDIRR